MVFVKNELGGSEFFNLARGIKFDPPGVHFPLELGGSACRARGFNPPNPPANITLIRTHDGTLLMMKS